MTGSGIHYRRTRGSGAGGYGASFRNAAKKVKGILEEEMERAGEEGLEEAQRFVRSAGTGRAWQGTFFGRTGSGRGRIDTGTMLETLTYRLIRGQDIGLDLGWLKNVEDYFTIQDEGFKAPGFRSASQVVQGMGLMEHMRTYNRGKVDEAMQRSIKRILSEL